MATETENLLSRFQNANAAIEFINCVKMQRGNLAITELEPDGNLRTAGVPVMMKVTIKNFSQSAAEKIQVRIQQRTFDGVAVNQVSPADIEPKVDDLPTVFIKRIGPGESETRRFPVLFNSIGQHVTVAQLPDDAIAVDNTRYNVTQFESLTRVLMIEDAPQLHSGFLSLALNPGAMTGIESTVRPREFLRDVAPEQLQEFDVVYLLDVERLADTAVTKLEKYALGGGGVAFFLGPKIDLNFYDTQLYRGGQGIFPMPLEKAVDVPEIVGQPGPDIVPEKQPIFEPILSAKNSLLNLVQIKRIVQPPLEWQPSRSDTVVAATVRGTRTWPLVLQQRYGNGQTMVVTTTAGPLWNNWSRNGTFPPIMLLMENELAAGRYPADVRIVGQPMQMQFDAKQFTPKLTLVAPSPLDALRTSTEYLMTPDPEDEGRLSFQLSAADGSIDQPGYYDAWLQTTTAKKELIRFALSLDCDESELAIVNQQTMMSGLSDARPALVAWDRFNPEPDINSSSKPTIVLLVVLLALLLAEQALAYSASYHAKPGAAGHGPRHGVAVAK